MVATLRELEHVDDLRRANVLLQPLRLRVLVHAREPRSATEIAALLGLTRQRVNYHVRALAAVGLLCAVDRRQRRGLFEQRYVASARTYQLAPELLGPLETDPARVDDRASAEYLLALAERVQRELGRAAREAREQERRIATMALDAELRFESAAQREAFSRALEDAVARVVAEHASPARRADGSDGPGRPFRLVLACHPIPPAAADGTGETMQEEEAR